MQLLHQHHKPRCVTSSERTDCRLYIEDRRVGLQLVVNTEIPACIRNQTPVIQPIELLHSAAPSNTGDLYLIPSIPLCYGDYFCNVTTPYFKSFTSFIYFYISNNFMIQ